MQEQVENLSTTPKPISEPQNLSTLQSQEKPKINFSIVEKWKEIMNSIKEKTGIDGIYVIVFLSICVLFVYLGIFGSLITSLVGTLYPGFSTIKSIQKNTRKKEWLTYWVVFGSFLIFDMFSNIIVKFIPFYFVLKILFLIWMFIPGSNGCKLVYEFLISKIMKPLEEFFDMFFKEYKEVQQEIVDKAKDRGMKLMKGMKDIMNLQKKMQQKKVSLEKKEKNKVENNINNDKTDSILTSAFNPTVNVENLLSQEKKEEVKVENKEENKVENKEEKSKEEKEKEEHINLNKSIEDFQSKFNNESQQKNEENENQGSVLSFKEEEDDDKNKN